MGTLLCAGRAVVVRVPKGTADLATGFAAQSPNGAISERLVLSVESEHLNDLSCALRGPVRREGLQFGMGATVKDGCDCSGRIKKIERDGVCGQVPFRRAARLQLSPEREGGGAGACVSDLLWSVNAVQGRKNLESQNLGTWWLRFGTCPGVQRITDALPSYRVPGQLMPAPWGAQSR